MIDLKAWRTDRGMTQQQAADALGIGNSTVRAIEAGTREMTGTLALACHGWDAMHGNPVRALTHDERAAEALERRVVEPAAAPEPRPDMGPILDELAELHADMNRAWERLAEYGERLSGLDKGVLPATIRDDIVRRYEYHAQQQQQRIQARMNAAAALTDDEREEADKARRAIAKARSLAQGEPWE